MTPEPTFFYDFNSPYAYLAAHRVDRLLAERVRWQPIAFAFVLRGVGRTPWSFTDARPAGMRECEERAVRYGLPPLRWPPGWPVDSYTLAPLRAALVAEEHGRLRELSLAAFAENFVTGAGIREPEALERAVRAAGLDPDVVRDGIQRPEIKERLREVTDGALAAGVIGVPTVLVDGEAFWGDDQLEQAAARMAA